MADRHELQAQQPYKGAPEVMGEFDWGQVFNF